MTGPTPGRFVDVAGAHPVLASSTVFSGMVWDVQADTVALPAGDTVVRQVVRHPGAVAVLALDESDQVLVVHQYRHPAEATLWELPAGLLDAPGEDPLEAARRELWEETGYVADRWAVLVDFLTTPGFCDEAIRIYLVRGARLADGPAHERHGEERDMTVAWAPLDELRDAILGGQLHNPSLLVGVLAACAARAADWAPLRPADDAWAFGPRPLRTHGATKG